MHKAIIASIDIGVAAIAGTLALSTKGTVGNDIFQSSIPNYTSIGNDGSRSYQDENGNRISLTVDMNSNPQQMALQDSQNKISMTTFLPVSFTEHIFLSKPTDNLTIYPVLGNWPGRISPGAGSGSLYDRNSQAISYSGGGTELLRYVNATCAQPYFVKVEDDGLHGIYVENTTKAVSSNIFWGDTEGVRFDKPQDGMIRYVQSGYGIVPDEYIRNHNSTDRNIAAGNKVISGAYHLIFATFYPAIINLPDIATRTSYHELKCTINEDMMQANESHFPYIYVYDVWFRMP